jgi:hypothetical protein
MTQTYKGIAFVGCSFTWGQGLYFYSNMPTLQHQPLDTYDTAMVTDAQIEFMKTRRFPRLVANHFNTFELVQNENGGSNTNNIEWWNDCFSKTPSRPAWHYNTPFLPNYSYNELSHAVIQATQCFRDTFIFDHTEELERLKDFGYDASNDTYHSLLLKSDMVIDYLKHIGLTMNDWEFAFMQRSIQILKKLMQQFEDNGIKTSIMTWPDENVLHIENDHWLRDRFVKMQHNGILYNSIDRLMFSEPSLKILHDYDSFAVPPQDSHPSLQCHRIIADNLIKHLEKHDNL